jgi:hypothetical protein
MNKKKPKDILTPEQFRQQLQSKRDNGLTDWWLKTSGYNPNAFDKVCLEVVQAQQKANELLKAHANLLTPEQLALIEKFNDRLNDKRKRKKLKPSSAYPILNLCTKIYRQAHKNEMQARQSIQALRNNQ